MEKIFCNICGKEFDEFDMQEGFGFDYHIGYGSKFDGERIKIVFCCDCFDKIVDEYILPQCQIPPLREEYF